MEPDIHLIIKIFWALWIPVIVAVLVYELIGRKMLTKRRIANLQYGDKVFVSSRQRKFYTEEARIVSSAVNSRISAELLIDDERRVFQIPNDVEGEDFEMLLLNDNRIPEEKKIIDRLNNPDQKDSDNGEGSTNLVLASLFMGVWGSTGRDK